jgi:eukaryotic-like serine/threonine-protein kinase
LLAQFLPKESSTDAKNSEELNLSKISFASIQLDNSGKILDRPAGSALVFQENLGNGVSLTMVKIPAGKFMMGQTASEKQELFRVLEKEASNATDKSVKELIASEKERLASEIHELTRMRKEESYKKFAPELPQHPVILPEFYLGQTLVTQAQYQTIMGDNPSHFKGNDKLPVDSVSWLDSMDFCQKLSQKTGRTYRLPSEAEWEYACRAGTITPFAFGETITPAVVNYNGDFSYASAAQGEYRDKTTPVGVFPANAFGLYDMHGNLWEWCLDEWTNNYNSAPVDGSARGDINSRDRNKIRLLRGGSWPVYARSCRSANRFYSAAWNKTFKFGLRVVAVASFTKNL